MCVSLLFSWSWGLVLRLLWTLAWSALESPYYRFCCQEDPPSRRISTSTLHPCHNHHYHYHHHRHFRHHRHNHHHCRLYITPCHTHHCNSNCDGDANLNVSLSLIPLPLKLSDWIFSQPPHRLSSVSSNLSLLGDWEVTGCIMWTLSNAMWPLWEKTTFRFHPKIELPVSSSSCERLLALFPLNCLS